MTQTASEELEEPRRLFSGHSLTHSRGKVGSNPLLVEKAGSCAAIFWLLCGPAGLQGWQFLMPSVFIKISFGYGRTTVSCTYPPIFYSPGNFGFK